MKKDTQVCRCGRETDGPWPVCARCRGREGDQHQQRASGLDGRRERRWMPEPYVLGHLDQAATKAINRFLGW